MRRWMLMLLAAPLLMAAGSPRVYQMRPSNQYGVKIADGVIVNNQSIDSAVTSTVMTVNGFNTLTLSVTHTNSSATAVTVYCEHAEDLGPGVTAVWYREQTKACSSGTCTHYNRTDTFTVAASDQWTLEYGINYPFMRCVVTGTGADANDKATLTAMLAVN